MKLEEIIVRWAAFLEDRMKKIAMDDEPEGKGKYSKIHKGLMTAVITIVTGAVIFYLLNCVNDLNYQF